MGAVCTKWSKESCPSCHPYLLSRFSSCFSACSCSDWKREEDADLHSLERKLQQMEQRINTTDEANQRLHNKLAAMEDRIQQHHGDIRMLMVRCRTVEQRMDTASYEHCERLDDDIIVLEES